MSDSQNSDFASHLMGMVAEFEAKAGRIAWHKRVVVVLLRDQFTCAYCGATGIAMTADHVIPLSRGGSNEFSNLVCACESCNRSKGAKLSGEWRAQKNMQNRDLVIRQSKVTA